MEYNVDLYDGLDIFQENPLTLILKQMKPGRRVLEFGPAYGRMTRYLKERLNCSVTCVEINPRAKESLRQFADTVIIGDIESGEWKQRIVGKTFDYIVFADILEHLAAPELALAAAVPFLKEAGEIFISVPNIAHNAVIEGLYAEQFEYQESGILDKTHLRFFTRHSLQKMIEQAGLYVLDRQATYYTDEMTGILKPDTAVSTELRELLKRRENPEVYQLVYTAGRTERAGQGKNGGSDGMVSEPNDGMDSVKIYLDTGNGFSEETAYERKYNTSGEEICLELEFPEAVSVHCVRIDPSDSSCICEIKELVFVDADGKQHGITADRIISENSLRYENVFIFSHSDPQMMVPEPQTGLKAVRICFVVTYIAHRDSRLYTLLYALIDERAAQIDQLQNLLRSMEEVGEQRAQRNTELECRLTQVEKESTERGQRVEELLSEKRLLQAESDERAGRIAELLRQNELLKGESEERAAKNAELLSANEMLKKESEDRAVKIAELLSVNEQISLESQERSVRIAEIININETLTEESNARATQIAQLNELLVLSQSESAQRAEKMAKMESHVVMLQDESKARADRIAQLEFLLEQLEKKSSEWAQQIADCEDEVQSLKLLVKQKNQEIFRKNRLILEDSDVELKKDFKIQGNIKDKNI